MILAIDIGNTTVGIYGFDLDRYEIVTKKKLPTMPTWDTMEYATQFVDAGFAQYVYEGAVISSVVPCLTGVLEQAVKQFCKQEPLLLKAEDNPLLTFLVDDTTKLGVDRIVDATFAAANYQLPAITVDMGTATTINVINRERQFLGGMIAPGVETAFHALVSKAAQLSDTRLEAPKQLIGNNTISCMQSGTVIGAAAMIDGMVSRVEALLGEKVTLIMTGGLASIVEHEVLHDHIYDPDLLVKGMAYLYQNRQG